MDVRPNSSRGSPARVRTRDISRAGQPAYLNISDTPGMGVLICTPEGDWGEDDKRGSSREFWDTNPAFDQLLRTIPEEMNIGQKAQLHQ